MNIRIKRIDKTIPLPEYKTQGAAGFDLSARLETTILPKTISYIPLNVVIEPPLGYFTLLVPRSSLHKRGLMPANGVGIIDGDYSGNEDELQAALYNFTDASVVIAKGERIMQALFLPVCRPEFGETEDMDKQSRGGFGTTGR